MSGWRSSSMEMILPRRPNSARRSSAALRLITGSSPTTVLPNAAIFATSVSTLCMPARSSPSAGNPCSTQTLCFSSYCMSLHLASLQDGSPASTKQLKPIHACKSTYYISRIQPQSLPQCCWAHLEGPDRQTIAAEAGAAERCREAGGAAQRRADSAQQACSGHMRASFPQPGSCQRMYICCRHLKQHCAFRPWQPGTNLCL